MMTCCFRRFRRFRFNQPQRIAAVLLALFLAQGLWLIGHQSLTERNEQVARCGRAMWERPSQLSGGCGNPHDGILAYRLAGVSLALPFLAAGCLLGGGLWWVARRLYGNFGGYTALALYCFSPAVLKSCVVPNPDVLAALGVYGGVYTCIGVAHAMQGPRRKWRPRIVLLMVAFGLAAASEIVALPVVALLGLAFMLWVAEGRRRQVLPVMLLAMTGGLIFVFACYGFSFSAFNEFLHSAPDLPRFSLEPARWFFSSPDNAGITLATLAAWVLYLAQRRSRYFGNTTPLLCALGLMLLTHVDGAPWPWVLPFLLTFVGGVFADAYEGTKGRLAMGAAGAIVVMQAVFCVLSLPGVR
jgi:hypothetical protein